MIVFPEDTPALLATLEQRYQETWHDKMHRDTIKEVVVRAQSHAAEASMSVIGQYPDRFNLDDPTAVTALPRTDFLQWQSLEASLELLGVQGGVLNCLPVGLQLQYSVHLVLDRLGLFQAFSLPHNTTLAIDILEQTRVRTVVAEPAAAQLLYDALKTQNKLSLLESLVLIVDVRNLNHEFNSKESFAGVNVFRELHLFPGVVIAYQSMALMNQTAIYHLDPTYYWECVEGEVLLTGCTEETVPMVRFPIPGLSGFSPAATNTNEPAFSLSV